jgi:tetratricopeptide (TPR) repeat protein
LLAVFVLVLVWWWSPFAPIGVEKKLDTIQRNTENIQQDTQKIVALLEQELAIKNAHINFLQGQVERFQAQGPSPRARELAAHIPSDADPYALALKAIAEGRFDDARRLLGEAQKTKEVELMQIYQARAETEMYAGRYGDAVGWYEKALSINPDDARLLGGIGIALVYAGNYVKAESPLRQALAILEKALGPEHRDVATSLHNLALLYQAQGRYADAEPLYQRALAIQEKVLGPEHPDVATSLLNLALLYRAQSRYADAEPLYQRALAIQEKALGPEHRDVATSLHNLALLYQAQGRYADAEPLYQRALPILEKVLGPEHSYVATVGENYTALLRATHRDAEAARLKARWQTY